MKFKEFLANAAVEITGTIIGGIFLSCLFFVWSDYVFKQPNLNGIWHFTVKYENSSYSKFKNLSVTYEVVITQDGLSVIGSGEKIKEISNGEVIEYSGKGKNTIEIKGSIDQNYLSKDTLYLYYRERGEIRDSATFHNLIRFDDNTMEGTWQSTIASSSGNVNWIRKK